MKKFDTTSQFDEQNLSQKNIENLNELKSICLEYGAEIADFKPSWGRGNRSYNSSIQEYIERVTIYEVDQDGAIKRLSEKRESRFSENSHLNTSHGEPEPVNFENTNVWMLDVSNSANYDHYSRILINDPLGHFADLSLPKAV